MIKLTLPLLVLLICFGCSNEKAPPSNKESDKEQKTHFGKAINETQQIGKSQELRDQRLKEQADSL